MELTEFIDKFRTTAANFAGRIILSTPFRNCNLDHDDVAVNALRRLFEASQKAPDRYGHIAQLDSDADEIWRILRSFCYYAALTLRKNDATWNRRWTTGDVQELPIQQDADSPRLEEERQERLGSILRVCTPREREILQTLAACEYNYPVASAQLGISASRISHVLAQVRTKCERFASISVIVITYFMTRTVPQITSF
jgi:hypothetical protein